ncbi:MAG: hypothetical protein ABIS21_07985 [Acidimicrobiales bacterium]
MAFAPRRRRHRPRWILVGVLVSLMALVVGVCFSSRSKGPAKRLAGLVYVDQVRPHVDASIRQGTDVVLIRDTAAALGPDGIRRNMERVRRDAATGLRGVRRIDPPFEFATTHSLLVSTMLLRSRAASTMTAAFAAAFGTAPPGPAVDSLVEAAEDLIAADHTYRAYAELVVVKGAKGPLLPESRWLSDPVVWQAPELSAFVAALRSSAVSTPVHDVGLLTFTTDPRPVASEAGSAVLPLVKALKVEVVVANIGNAAEKGVPVVATLTGPAGEADTAREFVDLKPGQRRAVTLGGLRPVAGGPSTLTVVIGPVEGEGGANDNQRSMSLVVRG